MRTAIFIGAALAALPLLSNAQAPQAARDLASSCAMCHGTDGRSAEGNEPLAGTPKADMVRKLNEFRTGARPATVMHQISKGYSERDINLIADYFAVARK